MFPICAKGDDQKLESQTLQRSQSQMRKLSYPQTQRHRRDAYATFRSVEYDFHEIKNSVELMISRVQFEPTFPTRHSNSAGD